MLQAWRREFEIAWLLQPQSEYVTDGDNLDVLLPNFIISFENLESDFGCMASLLGLSASLGRKNPSLSVEGELQQLQFHGRTQQIALS